MSEHPIKGLLDSALQNIRQLVDVDTIIGEQITTPDGTVIIPISKVSLGFASGGSDLPTKTEKDLFGGGSGAGATITPVAFIVVSQGQVKMMQITSNSSTADNAISMVPELIDKIVSLFNKDKKKENPRDPTAEPPADSI